MQNRYVADLGDFGKYGILRALCNGDKNISLGVVWYLFPDENNGNNDGKHKTYLANVQPTICRNNCQCYRNCDPQLYDLLKEILQDRTVQNAKLIEVLGANTKFYEKILSYEEVPVNERIDLRSKWLDGALERTKKCNLVFFDPDNGLQVPSVEIQHRKAPKYAYYDEIKAFFTRRQSLIIYHHLNRNRTHQAEIENRTKEIQEYLNPGYGVFALRYRRGTGRAYFVVPASKEHAKIFQKQARAMVDGIWGTHEHLEWVYSI
jgi:hypothetical protein